MRNRNLIQQKAERAIENCKKQEEELMELYESENDDEALQLAFDLFEKQELLKRYIRWLKDRKPTLNNRNPIVEERKSR